MRYLLIYSLNLLNFIQETYRKMQSFFWIVISILVSSCCFLYISTFLSTFLTFLLLMKTIFFKHHSNSIMLNDLILVRLKFIDCSFFWVPCFLITIISFLKFFFNCLIMNNLLNPLLIKPIFLKCYLVNQIHK